MTPVVYGLLNTLVQSEVNEDAGNMAAIDPSAFGQVAPLIDTDFVGTTAANAMDALERQPGGVLLEIEFADLLDVEPGDEVQVLFARATQNQKLSEMNVIGLFQRLPGFGEGVHVLANIERQMELIPSTNATFFLAQTTDPSDATLDRVVAELQAGPGSADALQIDTRATALDKDQSSLAALNIRGLLALDSAYALAMAATAITIFVFGLLLQRRRSTSRCVPRHADRKDPVAAGHRILMRRCRRSGRRGTRRRRDGLLPGDRAAALFVLRPEVVIPRADIAVLAALVLAVSVAASLAATTLIRRLPPGSCCVMSNNSKHIHGSTRAPGVIVSEMVAPVRFRRKVAAVAGAFVVASAAAACSAGASPEAAPAAPENPTPTQAAATSPHHHLSRRPHLRSRAARR